MAETDRRRRRPAVSCSLCRKRKIRCNRDQPCSNCVRSKNQDCLYESHVFKPQRPHLTHSQVAEQDLNTREVPSKARSHSFQSGETVSAAGTSTTSGQASSVSTPWSFPDTLDHVEANEDVNALKAQIQRLQDQLARFTPAATPPTAQNPDSSIETMNSRICGTFHVRHENRSSNNNFVNQSVMHKTRLFGQSHWCNSVLMFVDMFKTMEPHIRGDSSKIATTLRRCKRLGQIIKTQRGPLCTSTPGTMNLPSRDIADNLLACYIRTTESIYRILHIPTFKQEYEAFWLSDAPPDTAFLVQLKLVLAIGACTYDKNFSLRRSAIQWVYEAQQWFAGPGHKARLSIQALQSRLLLLLAREVASIGDDLIWISTGNLLQTAILMGLHRDPSHLPRKTLFVMEMRRRLWNSILEMLLQSSIVSGGPPLLTIHDFDTEPPGNFDDLQLTAESPMAEQENTYSDTSTAIALRRTFAIRLAVTKFLNDLGSRGSYPETLQLDTELKASHRALRRTLQECQKTSTCGPSHFELRAADLIMCHYRLALHVPYFTPAVHEPGFAYSRKIVIETALRIWTVACPSSNALVYPCKKSRPGDDDDLRRFIICGNGFFLLTASQAGFVIAGELKLHIQEEAGHGPVAVRSDLVLVLEEIKSWMLRCIEAGETNVKGYLLISLATALVTGVFRGVQKEEIPQLLVKVIEDATEVCLKLLEEKEAESQTRSEAHKHELESLDTSLGIMEGWEFMVPDMPPVSGTGEDMGWNFGSEMFGEPVLW